MRQFFQVFLLAAGSGEDLISQDGNGFEGFILMRSEQMVGAKVDLIGRQKQVELVSPLRLDGGIGAEDDGRAFDGRDHLQADDGLAGAGRSDYMDLAAACVELFVDKVDDLFLVAAQGVFEG